MLRLDVPDAKSSNSTSAVFKPKIEIQHLSLNFKNVQKVIFSNLKHRYILPRVTESIAQPAPVAPPPIIRTSKSSDCND